MIKRYFRFYTKNEEGKKNEKKKRSTCRIGVKELLEVNVYDPLEDIAVNVDMKKLFQK